jgi:hypothetical protein
VKLSDWSANSYSQNGEDGVISQALHRMGGPGDMVCVEYGAGDGLGCSNTANLWHNGWKALLVEADPDLVQRAVVASSGFDVTVKNAKVAPDGVGSIDDLLDTEGIGDVDFMSIDIDGDDYWHLVNLKRRPRLLCVEFNPTIPSHLSIVPSGPGNHYGVGARTLREAAELRGYSMIGIIGCNMFFVRTEDAEVFKDLEADLSVLLPPESFMYLTTDYAGHIVPVGGGPRWGLAWPPSKTAFVPNQDHLLDIEVRDPAQAFVASVEKFKAISRQTVSQLGAILEKR